MAKTFKHAPVRVPHSSHVVTDNNITDAAALPTPNPAVVDAICDMLMTNKDVRRPPEVTAALLALTVELHKRNQPFPSRMAAAIKLGCSVFTIDAALSTRMDEGLLTQIVETSTGHVAKRSSTIRQRFYKPSQELLDVADAAMKPKRKRS